MADTDYFDFLRDMRAQIEAGEDIANEDAKRLLALASSRGALESAEIEARGLRQEPDGRVLYAAKKPLGRA